MDKIYFEKQESRLCGLHTLNMLLQKKRFSSNDLMDIALDLDRKERVLELDVAAAKSENYDSTGYFSIQVITTALKKDGFEVVNIEHPDAAAFKKTPSAGVGYICNQNEHWFAVRRLGEQWFELNSLKDGPIYLSHLHLDIYFQELIQRGYSVFMVSGVYPACKADEALKKCPYVPKDEKGFPIKGGQRLGGAPPAHPPVSNGLSDFEIGVWNTGPETEVKSGGSGKAEVASTAIGASPPDYDVDLERAIQLSLQDQAGPSTSSASGSGVGGGSSVRRTSPVDEDEELQRAIAASLADQFVDEDERQFQLALQMSMMREETPQEEMRRKREQFLDRLSKN